MSDLFQERGKVEGVEYDPLSVNEYQKQYDAQQVKYMQKKAARLGYELVPV